MISYIVPTMWKYEPFLDFISDIIEHPLIGEVIIIDNNFNERPNHSIFANNKVKLLNFGKNVFVNPSWNEGVKNSKYDKLAIANDDIIYDLRVFDKVYDYIKDENGPIGLSVDPNAVNDAVIRIKEYNFSMSQLQFPQLMFMHKNFYDPVPSGLDFYFGDSFVFDNALWKNKKIFAITDIFFYTPGTMTCRHLDLNGVYQREREVYKQVIIDHGHIPEVWSGHFR